MLMAITPFFFLSFSFALFSIRFIIMYLRWYCRRHIFDYFITLFTLIRLRWLLLFTLRWFRWFLHFLSFAAFLLIFFRHAIFCRLSSLLRFTLRYIEIFATLLPLRCFLSPLYYAFTDDAIDIFFADYCHYYDDITLLPLWLSWHLRFIYAAFIIYIAFAMPNISAIFALRVEDEMPFHTIPWWCHYFVFSLRFLHAYLFSLLYFLSCYD